MALSEGDNGSKVLQCAHFLFTVDLLPEDKFTVVWSVHCHCTNNGCLTAGTPAEGKHRIQTSCQVYLGNLALLQIAALSWGLQECHLLLCRTAWSGSSQGQERWGAAWTNGQCLYPWQGVGNSLSSSSLPTQTIP